MIENISINSFLFYWNRKFRLSRFLGELQVRQKDRDSLAVVHAFCYVGFVIELNWAAPF